MHACVRACMHACMHACIHTYIRTYMYRKCTFSNMDIQMHPHLMKHSSVRVAFGWSYSVSILFVARDVSFAVKNNFTSACTTRGICRCERLCLHGSICICACSGTRYLTTTCNAPFKLHLHLDMRSLQRKEPQSCGGRCISRARAGRPGPAG